MIEKFKINDSHIGICYSWYGQKRFLYDVRRVIDTTNKSEGFVSLTGWISVYRGYRRGGSTKIWFLKGYESTPQEVFDSLTDEEKTEAIWELNEWKLFQNLK